MNPVLLDTGVIIALLDRRERYHEACVEVVANIAVPLVTCEAVIAESCYLLRNIDGAKETVLENVASGVFQIPVRLADVASDIRRIIRKYQDREVDLADACLIHLATALKIGDILTLDSDFKVYRWGANKSFRSLIPGI